MRLKSTVRPFAVIALALLAMLTGAASAATFYLYDDFPMVSNPTSPWGFFSQATALDNPHGAEETALSVFEPAVALEGGGFSPSFASWSQTGATGYGALVARHDPGVEPASDVFFWPAPTVNTLIQFLFPGAAPALVSVVVELRDGDPVASIDGETFSILHNDTVKFVEFLPPGPFAAKNYAFSIVMEPGDALYVVNDPFNQASADTLFVDMTVTTSPIPLPATAWLFGAAGLILLRRCARRTLWRPALRPAALAAGPQTPSRIEGRRTAQRAQSHPLQDLLPCTQCRCRNARRRAASCAATLARR